MKKFAIALAAVSLVSLGACSPKTPEGANTENAADNLDAVSDNLDAAADATSNGAASAALSNAADNADAAADNLHAAASNM